MDPTPERFVALARSSPWRWRTLRLRVLRGWGSPPFRALVRRPDGLRVEALDGTLLNAERQEPSRSRLFTSTGRGGDLVRPWSFETTPIFAEDGLVRRRPSEHEAQYDDPMLRDYRWVAMLDPVELADGHGRWLAEPQPDPVDVDGISAIDHHGREAWEALVRPGPSYDPRCPCCALLFSVESRARESADGGPTAADSVAGDQYADAHRVTLDVGTGVCVRSEEIGGSRPGWGHEVAIEAVDEAMPDELFAKRGHPLLEWIRR
ncbi:MAG: hypothetical protein KY450_13335 [Actinobacteria bacterium]|nr:hypothetical protein [Actinomycetota bacterium]